MEVGRRLRGVLRPSDTVSVALEFAVLLEGMVPGAAPRPGVAERS